MGEMKTSSSIDRQITPIVETIVRTYHPEKIVLFGSLAAGHRRTARDIDLLVVKRTKKNPWARLAELDRWLDHQVPIDVLVYTPAEVGRYLKRGDEFFRTVMRAGRVVYEKAA